MVELREHGEPDEARIVGVACRHDTAGCRDPAHLAQRLHGIADVLEHLVRVHDVEGVVGEAQRMHVFDREVEVVQTSARREIA